MIEDYYFLFVVTEITVIIETTYVRKIKSSCHVLAWKDKIWSLSRRLFTNLKIDSSIQVEINQNLVD